MSLSRISNSCERVSVDAARRAARRRYRRLECDDGVLHRDRLERELETNA